MAFKPKRVMFEQAALEYPLGSQLYQRFKHEQVPVSMIGSHNRVTGIPGKNPVDAWREGKATLVVGVRKTLDFSTCKPSAHYQLPLYTGCPGKCEYCYLMTTLGNKPYLRTYVNLEEIFNQAEQYIHRRSPELTVFEGAATSDPVPLEAYTGALAKTITFFAKQPLGRFRFVTKFTAIEPMLDLEHAGHTTVRFSINTERVIDQWEHATPKLALRVQAAQQIMAAGYPLGFIVAPIFLLPHWQEEYLALLHTLRQTLNAQPQVFEFISHRFTTAAQTRINAVFPESTLPMTPAERRYKYGQFGYGKYVYPKETLSSAETWLRQQTQSLFPDSQILYFV